MPDAQDREAGGDVSSSATNNRTRQTSIIEAIVYRAVAAALIDTGCTPQYANVVVDYGLSVVKEACKRVLRPLA